MSKAESGMTRRDFIRLAAYAAVGTAAGAEALAGEGPASGTRSRVVLVRDKNAVAAGGKIDADVVRRMMDRGVSELVGADDPVECWRQLVGTPKLVGIKTNVWANLPTPAAVEQVIEQRLRDAGLAKGRIPKTDREARRTLASCDALINARPLRSHHWAGIGGCIKNHIMFAPRPSAYHPDSCADLAAVWSLPPVKGKTRLNILVALTPLFYGRGPHHWNPRYVWPYKGIFFSRDPVAADALGAHLLATKRHLHFGKDRPITPTKHIRMAEVRHHLGVADLKRIDLVKVGWEKDALI
jgi:hypothetical protein